MLKQLGDVSVDEINDANIPVNIFISKDKIEGAKGKWNLKASNFCPRKDYIYASVYNFEADAPEEFYPFLEKTKALYQAALINIYKMLEGKSTSLYYWGVE